VNESILKLIFSAGATITTYAFGGWSAVLGVLVALVVIDQVTGIVASIKDGTGLSSRVGFIGISKKVFIFVVIAMCHWFDGLLNLNGILMDAAIYFYIANETISIIENLGRIDVLIPEQLKQIITVLRNKDQNK